MYTSRQKLGARGHPDPDPFADPYFSANPFQPSPPRPRSAFSAPFFLYFRPLPPPPTSFHVFPRSRPFPRSLHFVTDRYTKKSFVFFRSPSSPTFSHVPRPAPIALPALFSYAHCRVCCGSCCFLGSDAISSVSRAQPARSLPHLFPGADLSRMSYFLVRTTQVW
jgi:hypothetical protein